MEGLGLLPTVVPTAPSNLPAWKGHQRRATSDNFKALRRPGHLVNRG